MNNQQGPQLPWQQQSNQQQWQPHTDPPSFTSPQPWQDPGVQYPPTQQPYYPPPVQQPYAPPVPYGYPPRSMPYPPPQWGVQGMPGPYPPQMPYPPYYPPPVQQPIYIVNQVSATANAYGYGYRRPQQLSFLVRALYFCFIGWWLGIFWATMALCLICTIIGAPIGFLMLSSLPVVLTLHQK